jgi:hypothetical protein
MDTVGIAFCCDPALLQFVAEFTFVRADEFTEQG